MEKETIAYIKIPKLQQFTDKDREVTIKEFKRVIEVLQNKDKKLPKALFVEVQK